MKKIQSPAEIAWRKQHMETPREAHWDRQMVFFSAVTTMLPRQISHQHRLAKGVEEHAKAESQRAQPSGVSPWLIAEIRQLRLDRGLPAWPERPPE
jgi:hypothetical protein